LGHELRYQSLILAIHTLGFLAILIPLFHLAPHGGASDVFVNFIDPTDKSGYKSGGLAFLVGLTSSNLPFIGKQIRFLRTCLILIQLIGYGGPIHMAEEVKNAATVVP
jgi:choline transport protein